MRQNRIGLYQIGILTFFFTRCFFIMGMIPLLFEKSGIDSLVSILLGTILGLFLVGIYLLIMEKEKDKHIFEAIDQSFPKAFAFPLKILLILTLLLLGSFLLSQIALYINNSFLGDSSLFIIALTFLLLCDFTSKKGLEQIARSAEIIFMLFLLLFLLSLFGIIPLMEPSRLKPFFSSDWIKIGHSSLLYGFCNSLPLFLLTMIPKDKIRSHKKLNKAVITGYLIASFTIFLTFVWMIGVLGIDLASYYQYPETAILKKVAYFRFIERIEGVLSISWLLDGAVVLSFLLFTIKSAIATFGSRSNSKGISVWYTICFLILLFLGNRTNFSLESLIFPLGITLALLPLIVLLQLYFAKQKKT